MDNLAGDGGRRVDDADAGAGRSAGADLASHNGQATGSLELLASGDPTTLRALAARISREQ